MNLGFINNDYNKKNELFKDNYPDLCSGINIITEIWNWDLYNENKIYKKSEFWMINESGGRMIPDSIDFKLKVYNIYNVFTGDTIGGFKLSVKIQLKYSQGSDCQFSLNPTISDEIPIIENKIINNTDFIEYNKPIEIYFKGFELKNLLNQHSKVNEDDNLHQIIVNTYIERLDGSQKCKYEYIHFVCCKAFDCNNSW